MQKLKTPEAPDSETGSGWLGQETRRQHVGVSEARFELGTCEAIADVDDEPAPMIVQAERDLLEGAEASSLQAAGASESAPAKATSFATTSSQEPEVSLLPVTPGGLEVVPHEECSYPILLPERWHWDNWC